MLSMLSQVYASVVPQGASALHNDEGGISSAENPLPSLPKPRERAVPANNPGTWVTPDDYPDMALMHNATGATGFRLFIDEKGAVYDCAITQSSGFDVLDEKVCSLLRERARFRPARNAKGQAARDSYASRIVWRLPESEPLPLASKTQKVTLQIDRVGAVLSCVREPVINTQPIGNDGCFENLPGMVALQMRGYGEEPVRLVDIEFTSVFDALSVDTIYMDRSGQETVLAAVWQIEISEAGTVTDCKMERQRGASAVLPNWCMGAYRMRFVPDPVPTGTASRRHGWVVLHLSRKTGP